MAVVKVLAVWQVLVLGLDESFLYVCNKNNRVLSHCRKPLWCVAGIFAVIYDELQQPVGVYIVLA